MFHLVQLPKQLDVTVITTCHPEYAERLGPCIESILHQQCEPVQHLISMDSRSSGSPAWQMEQMVRAAKTEWVTFLAADDYALPQHLGVYAAMIEEKPDRHVYYTACATPGRVMPQVNRPMTEHTEGLLAQGNVIPMTACIRRNVLLSKPAPMFESEGHEDWHVMRYLVATHGRRQFVYSPEVTWLYNQHPASRSNKRAVKELAGQTKPETLGELEAIAPV